mmetsp:Transcript_55170/g.167745  ORF Transcript_55170/g.167745 Transcript_55170/m.167745 type:complete len:210 (-) Transcript_55170:128-757(-)
MVADCVGWRGNRRLRRRMVPIEHAVPERWGRAKWRQHPQWRARREWTRRRRARRRSKPRAFGGFRRRREWLGRRFQWWVQRLRRPQPGQFWRRAVRHAWFRRQRPTVPHHRRFGGALLEGHHPRPPDELVPADDVVEFRRALADGRGRPPRLWRLRTQAARVFLKARAMAHGRCFAGAIWRAYGRDDDRARRRSGVPVVKGTQRVAQGL